MEDEAPGPMRFGAFIMTFNRPGELGVMLGRLAEQSRAPETILVVNNGDHSPTAEVVAGFKEQGAVHHHTGENLGPAGAANYACSRLLSEGYGMIYWGDDDNPPVTRDTLERLTGLLAPGIGGDRPVGAAGAVGAGWSWNSGRIIRLADSELGGTMDVDVIGGSSQFILSAVAMREVGLPDPRLFWGYEEVEYCLRMRRAGFRLLVDGDLMKLHRKVHGREGLKQQRRLFPDDSPVRRYYATRNYIYLMNERFDKPHLAWIAAFKAFLRIALSWTKGLKQAREISSYQARAVLDGFKGRLGRKEDATK